MKEKQKLVIIGAGPAGYTAAFYAADKGLNVTLIDSDVTHGGTCLNRGCIPSKALLHAAKLLTDAKDAKTCGIEFGDPSIDIEKLRTWKDGIVTRLTGGLAQLTKKRNIQFIQGQASFTSSSSLQITKVDGSIESLNFAKAIIATGSKPATLSFLPQTSRVWDSTAALALPFVPETLLVIGGGYIGLELGSVYHALGSDISVVEALPQLLNGPDRDLADILIRSLKKKFKKIHTETKILSAEKTSDGLKITMENAKGKILEKIFSQVLVSVGRKPVTKNLELQNTDVTINTHGFIEVDPSRQTMDQNILAIGDVTGQPMLAHKASSEAKVAIDSLLGKSVNFAPKAIPAVIFTDPELAWSGITELEAQEQNLDVKVSTFPWAASGRALTLGRRDGLTKIIADKQTQKILGIGIVGPGAGDLISEGTLAIEKGLTAEDLTHTIHPHPTLSETIMETAEGLFGKAIHLP